MIISKAREIYGFLPWFYRRYLSSPSVQPRRPQKGTNFFLVHLTRTLVVWPMLRCDISIVEISWPARLRKPKERDHMSLSTSPILYTTSIEIVALYKLVSWFLTYVDLDILNQVKTLICKSDNDLRAGLDGGGEVHRSVKNFSPRQGTLFEASVGMVDKMGKQWNKKTPQVGVLQRQGFSSRVFGCPRDLTSREPPSKKWCHVGHQCYCFIHAYSSPPEKSWP